METINQKSIDTLNNLLEINNDRIEGYKHAIGETNESDLKSLFSQFANTSYKCKLELTSEIEKMGGEPVTGTRNTGKLYRAWMDIKAALSGKDRKAILNSCETGEDVAVKNYEDALKNGELESPVYNLINSQFGIIKSEHDKIKTLRDNLVK
jgi:uncharacterized protein (TIGR02284 family)